MPQRSPRQKSPSSAGHVVSIGGGGMMEGGTLSIDREMVRLTGKKRPRALFVPTASTDAADYVKGFDRIYGDRLGCRVEHLLVAHDDPGPRAIRQAIRGADLIYVGGGNTLKMMRRWRRLGIDREMKAAHRRGTVLCGLSAGAICWYRRGHSDSMFYYHPEDWDYILVRGLDLFPATCCPHLDGEKRGPHLARAMMKAPGVAVGVDNHCAFDVSGGRYRVLRSKRGKHAWLYRRVRGEMVIDRLPDEGPVPW